MLALSATKQPEIYPKDCKKQQHTHFNDFLFKIPHINKLFLDLFPVTFCQFLLKVH